MILFRMGLAAPPPLWRAGAPLLVPGAAVLLLGLPPFDRPRSRAGTFLLAAVLAGELLRLHFAINTFASRETNFPPHPYIDTLTKLMRDGTQPRFLVDGGLRLLPPNTGSIYELHDVRGYSNIPIARFRLLLECAENSREMRNFPTLTRIDSPIYRLLNVAYIFTKQPLDRERFEQIRPDLPWRRRESLGRAFLVHDVRMVRNESEMRAGLGDPAFDPGAVVYLEDGGGPPPIVAPREGPEAVHVTLDNPTRVSIEATATAPGVLVLSDAYYPGWRATLDGRAARILPANWGLRGVGIPAGVHRVTFEYRPAWLPAGWLASAVGLLLVVLLLRARGAGPGPEDSAR